MLQTFHSLDLSLRPPPSPCLPSSPPPPLRCHPPVGAAGAPQPLLWPPPCLPPPHLVVARARAGGTRGRGGGRGLGGGRGVGAGPGAHNAASYTTRHTVVVVCKQLSDTAPQKHSTRLCTAQHKTAQHNTAQHSSWVASYSAPEHSTCMPVPTCTTRQGRSWLSVSVSRARAPACCACTHAAAPLACICARPGVC